jgi:hypothetical protein
MRLIRGTVGADIHGGSRSTVDLFRLRSRFIGLGNRYHVSDPSVLYPDRERVHASVSPLQRSPDLDRQMSEGSGLGDIEPIGRYGAFWPFGQKELEQEFQRLRSL